LLDGERTVHELAARLGGDGSAPGPPDAAPIESLVADLERRGIVVRRLALSRKFAPFARRAHQPRVLIDRLVIAREQWSMTPPEMPFAQLSDAFARSSLGEKPLYVDLHSPPLVDLLAKRVRDLRDESEPWLTISEMLPGPDGCWLHDRDGRRLTSEIRLTAVDTRPWREQAIPWPAS
jgi:hypothetical protein